MFHVILLSIVCHTSSVGRDGWQGTQLQGTCASLQYENLSSFLYRKPTATPPYPGLLLDCLRRQVITKMIGLYSLFSFPIKTKGQSNVDICPFARCCLLYCSRTRPLTGSRRSRCRWPRPTPIDTRPGTCPPRPTKARWPCRRSPYRRRAGRPHGRTPRC